MSGKVLLLTTSSRVAPGLLTWPAWQLLRTSDVLAGDPQHPQLPYLRGAGVAYSLVKPFTEAERARMLADRVAGGGTVVWLDAPDGDAGLRRALDDLVGSRPGEAPEVEELSGSCDLPGARLLDLVSTMDRLRSPGGCPWDREQTHASLVPYLLEETYEVAETVETGDLAALPEELGDVLLQVAFHARVAQERDDGTAFTIDDVADAIVEKLVRRHPHVFGDVEVSGADEVTANWDAIKAEERAGKTRERGATDGGGEQGGASIFSGVPLGQPALSLAYALQKRAARAGYGDESAATKDGTNNLDISGEAIGAELFSLVARARALGVDPETALRSVARDFRDRLLAGHE